MELGQSTTLLRSFGWLNNYLVIMSCFCCSDQGTNEDCPLCGLWLTTAEPCWLNSCCLTILDAEQSLIMLVEELLLDKMLATELCT